MTDDRPSGPRPPVDPPFKMPQESLAPGDRAPNFVLPDAKGIFRAFYERVRGRPLVLLTLSANAAGPLIDAFAAQRETFETKGYDVIAIVTVDVATASVMSERIGDGLTLLADPKGAITRGYAAGTRVNPEYPCCYLLDSNQRLLIRRSDAGEEPAALAQWALRCLDELARPVEAQRIGSVAPVLILPNVVDRVTCDALIDRWTRFGNEEGSVTSVVDGKEVTRVHDPLKRRRDHAIDDPMVLRALATMIGRRIGPELVKAFHFEAFKFDRFIVTCYDSGRGDYFRAHRDSESASTSDRRFAITLNLNTGDYEGGELLFPEYGPHRYAPPAGGAIIFSCSLLHEAMPVTKGRRFTLLSFLSVAARQPQVKPAPGGAPSPAAPAGGFNPGGPNQGGGFNPGTPSKDGLTRAGD